MFKKLIVVAALVVGLGGCATSSVAPVQVGDTPANRVYWDNYAGDGYRIKVTRDAGRMGSLCMTQVYVDGQLAADLGQAESAVFKVSPGSHTLAASPSLATSLCKKFYSAPQFRVQDTVEGSAGQVKAFRYGFNGSGLPYLAPAGN